MAIQLQLYPKLSRRTTFGVRLLQTACRSCHPTRQLHGNSDDGNPTDSAGISVEMEKDVASPVGTEAGGVGFTRECKRNVEMKTHFTVIIAVAASPIRNP